MGWNGRGCEGEWFRDAREGEVLNSRRSVILLIASLCRDNLAIPH